MMNRKGLNKAILNKFQSMGGMNAMPTPKRMGEQSGYNAPRSPMGMATRPPLIANKERGTMSSANRAAMGMF
jgi:hypothetical protein